MSGSNKRSYLSPTFTTHNILAPYSHLALSFNEVDENIFDLDDKIVQDADEDEGGATKLFWAEWEY